MGICATCQQVAAVLQVLTAAAGRLAASRATAGPLQACWDRCVATTPARACPCGSGRLRWGEDEAT